jgi:hypothetical protein
MTTQDRQNKQRAAKIITQVKALWGEYRAICPDGGYEVFYRNSPWDGRLADLEAEWYACGGSDIERIGFEEIATAR